ncbi:MAG TPA: hypothetical protein VLL27_09015 [Solirubrobacterales bacterium]|nr:hypothetical protein [Solirubrobacterales bacterium]
MSERRRKSGSRRLVAALVVLLALAAFGAGLARGERTQHGNLIVSLDGGLSPLQLPRDHPSPVSVHLSGGLQTADRSVLPRVTKIEFGLPGQGVLTTRGLPVCPQRLIRHTLPVQALAACRAALVGHGNLRAEVLLPNQPSFQVHASLLAFNGNVEGKRAVLLHAYVQDPPTVIVLPFRIRLRSARLGTTLVADLPPSLGPWPHFAHFEMTLSRRYAYRGERYSYLGASCPIPSSLTAGFFSFARATYTLAGGREVGTSIPRSCRAR